MSETLMSLRLYRVDPGRNMARFYALSIQPDLFGETSLVRNWGRIGCRGQIKIDAFKDVNAASRALEHLATRKRRRGYRS